MKDRNKSFSKKKVILSLVDLSFDKLGSFETLLLSLSQKLIENNYESILIFRETVPDRFLDKCTGITTDSLSRSDNSVRFYYQLAKIILKYKPDIVHLGFYPLFSPMNFIIYLCGCHSIIVTDHLSGETPNHYGFKKGLVFLRNKFFNYFTKKVTCVSNFVYERNKLIPGVDANKLMRLYLGVNLNRFKPMTKTELKLIRQEFNIRQDSFVVCTAAHLIKDKGIDHFIRAAQQITEKHSDVLFLIIGKGKEENSLKKLAQDLGLNNKVIFLGLRDDTERIMAISNVFVCPSVWMEAFGLTNIEAMACGIPVVASKVGGIPEIIEENITGILVEKENPRALADAIEQLYNDPELRMSMSEQSIKSVKQRFDLDRTITETIAIYEHD